jgi:hypothetical protein
MSRYAPWPRGLHFAMCKHNALTPSRGSEVSSFFVSESVLNSADVRWDVSPHWLIEFAIYTVGTVFRILGTRTYGGVVPALEGAHVGRACVLTLRYRPPMSRLLRT